MNIKVVRIMKFNKAGQSVEITKRILATFVIYLYYLSYEKLKLAI